VRGYGSLLMLQVLMDEIKAIEQSETQPHESSFCPYELPMRSPSHSNPQAMDGRSVDAGQRARPETRTSAGVSSSRSPSPADSQLRPSLSGYLPCHYFDYIGGTSTGGWVMCLSQSTIRID
jgi:hypothetical protein